jgi:hypothetical protein
MTPMTLLTATEALCLSHVRWVLHLRSDDLIHCNSSPLSVAHAMDVTLQE